MSSCNLSFQSQVFGGAITVSQEIKGIDDFAKGFGGKVSAKWKHACGFSVDKFDNDLSKGTVLETSYSKFPVKGLALAVNLKKTYGDKGKTVFPLELKYDTDVVSGSLATTAPAFKEYTANLTLATEGLLVGTSLQFKDGKASDYPISLSYSSKSYVAGIEATNQLKAFTVLGSYKVTPDLKVAIKALVPEGDKKSTSVAATYNLNDAFESKIAAMYSQAAGFSDKKDNKEATLECAVIAKPVKQVETGVALAFPLSSPTSFKYGLTFTLG